MSKILKSLPFFISGLLLLSVLFVTGFTNKDEEPIRIGKKAEKEETAE